MLVTVILFFQKNKSCAELCRKQFLKKKIKIRAKIKQKRFFNQYRHFVLFEKTKLLLNCAANDFRKKNEN